MVKDSLGLTGLSSLKRVELICSTDLALFQNTTDWAAEVCGNLKKESMIGTLTETYFPRHRTEMD
ncbi:unnamed protein product [Prunus armeniaca]|uniref:Uncharacterized protein n=1 Tax=Prunus armeniaca TaxID=36596 RepID=A0A6J5W460_PRUAR|nr:unnamed protein product [Prunus armeniaca]